MVTDAQNPRGERFTDERLLALLEQPISSAAALLDTSAFSSRATLIKQSLNGLTTELIASFTNGPNLL
jgi:hypothetical protein